MNNSDRKTIAPFAHPVYVMLKPVGATCNMACDYCYYTEKAVLYGQRQRPHMDYETLELFTQQYIEMQTQREVLFTWHGGEPLTMPLEFYEKAVELQQKYANGHVVDNCLQTNGTLINDHFARFHRKNGWLVGVSVDGDESMHDAYRRTRGGKPSFSQVMKGIDTLNRHGVEWNAMAVVNNVNVKKPLQFYRFFKSIGCRYIQFTPIVERTCHGHLATLTDNPDECLLTPTSISAMEWGFFLCNLFDEWVAGDIGDIFIQLFEATIANMMGREPGVCSMSKNCGNSLVMEYNGDVYSCDHFVFNRYRLGNIHDTPLAEMAYGAQQNAFRKQKSMLPRQCQQCRWLNLCYGECPKNRFGMTNDGEMGKNHLCEGYKMFFEHAEPYLKILVDELR